MRVEAQLSYEKGPSISTAGGTTLDAWADYKMVMFTSGNWDYPPARVNE